MDAADRESPRERILAAVLRLLDEGGEAAVSTRAVGAAARVQAPAIYRIFGDKQGLLEAAVERGYADWVRAKADRPVPTDAVDALRSGWDDAVDFGLAHPDMYRIASARAAHSAAFSAGRELLKAKVHRVATLGRLRIDEDQAVALMQAAGRGVTLAVLDAAGGTDLRWLGALARETVIAAITTEVAPDRAVDLRSTAAALRALLPQVDVLRPSERALMGDWLDEIVSVGARSSDCRRTGDRRGSE